MQRFGRPESIGVPEESVTRGKTPSGTRIDGESSGVRIQAQAVEAPTFLVGFSAVECRPFNLPVRAENAGGDHSKGNVGRVLPVMGQRRERIVHRGRAV